MWKQRIRNISLPYTFQRISMNRTWCSRVKIIVRRKRDYVFAIDIHVDHVCARVYVCVYVRCEGTWTRICAWNKDRGLEDACHDQESSEFQLLMLDAVGYPITAANCTWVLDIKFRSFQLHFLTLSVVEIVKNYVHVLYTLWKKT